MQAVQILAQEKLSNFMGCLFIFRRVETLHLVLAARVKWKPFDCLDLVCKLPGPRDPSDVARVSFEDSTVKFFQCKRNLELVRSKTK